MSRRNRKRRGQGRGKGNGRGRKSNRPHPGPATTFNLLLIPVEAIDLRVIGPPGSALSYQPDVARTLAVLDRLPPGRPVIFCGRIGEMERFPEGQRYETGSCHLCGSALWVNRGIVERTGCAEPLLVCHQHTEAETETEAGKE